MELDEKTKNEILGVIISRIHAQDLRELVDFGNLEDGQLDVIIAAAHARYNENKVFNIRVNAIVQDIVNVILSSNETKIKLN